ncbi:hypothetical protein GCM10023189_37490 [Nibrella saemangeumensis]|uniref:PKD domain-containing protein n=1 Tax=Nibrella saemangeumensis TaxID=1084526 RepID=A0ABP8N5M4_9BACT
MIAENGQEKISFYYHLEHCCQQVSEGYGKPDRAAWTNSDYIQLSNILYRKTSVRISPNTLKRIFGKIKTDSRYYPQKATRNALASYVGYSDWESFVEATSVRADYESPSVNPDGQPEIGLVAEDLRQSPRQTKPAPKRWLWLTMLVALMLTAVALLLPETLLSDTISTNRVQLVCKNPVGENPHSANFDVLGFTQPADQLPPFTIDFGDGRHKPVALKNRRHNHYYEMPGRYFAVLRQGTALLDTATVYLPTNGWAATAYMMYDTSRVYPIERKNLFLGGQRSISAGEAAQAGVDTNRTFFIEFANTQVTPIDGDNFELTTGVVTSPTRTGVRCSQVSITVNGESSNHSFHVMKPGCEYWTKLNLSEQLKTGEQDDLRFLGADLRTGGTLKLRVLDQRAQLFINDRKVYEGRYQKPLKRVYGVSIRFAGIGQVNFFTLKDLKTGSEFNGNF